MRAELLNQLTELLGPAGVLTGDDVAARPAAWGHTEPCAAAAIARPADTTQVAEVLSRCHAAGQTVVTQGGMTGLVEGGLAGAGDLVLSLERMNRVESLDRDNRSMLVQAGVPVAAAQQAAEAAGLMFAVDFGARGSATIGGAIATNAGGTRVLRYGMMRENVLGVEAVLADGTILNTLSKAIKNNTGYDLRQLFVGSEGTLGVVTRAVLRLRQQPASQITALVALHDFEALTRLLHALDAGLAGTLSSFELMWDDFYRLVTSPPALGRPPLSQDYPLYVLVEALGAEPDDDLERMERLLAEQLQRGVIADAVVSRSQRESRALWALRDDVEQMWRFEPVFTFDVSLGVGDMAAYVQRLRTALAQRWPDHLCFVFGHIADGNLHVTISAGSAEDRHAVEELVYGPLARLHGSVSAEHGIGLEKREWLGISRSPQEIALMRAIKQTMDPRGILNPGKIF